MPKVVTSKGESNAQGEHVYGPAQIREGFSLARKLGSRGKSALLELYRGLRERRANVVKKAVDRLRKLNRG